MSDQDSKGGQGGRTKTRFEPVRRGETTPGSEPAEAPPGAAQPPPTASGAEAAPPPQAPPKPPPAAPAARPQAPPAKPAPAPPPQPLPTLRALEPGEAPGYSGLRRDERGLVVGPQGLVAIQGEARLAALLAALSFVADLSAGVTLEAPASELWLVKIDPPEDGAPRSQHYDAVQGALAAARLSAARARLYTGDGRAFVPYADPAGPHGFEIDGEVPRQGRVLLWPGEASWLPEPQPVPLLDTLLRVPLLRAPAEAPTTLALLTDRRLAALVGGYVQRHGLAYGVRFLSWRRAGAAEEVALFDIVSAGEVRPVPGFVCDFLRRLPRTQLLSDAMEPADLESEPPRRVLIAWGRRTPLYLPHVQDLLPQHGIAVLGEAPWGAGMIEEPPPRTTMERLIRVAAPAPARLALSAKPAGALTLRIELLRDGPARGPVHGLLLDQPALTRLRRMVRRLPAPFFAGARIALGDGVALILADEGHEIQGVPLGLPLSRAEPPELLLPRGMRLLPALPQDLLIPTLGLAPETLTVLTPAARYDIAPAALRPLASLLSLDGAVPTSPIEVRPTSLPPLDLTDLEPPPAAPPPASPPAPPPQPAEVEPRPGGQGRGNLFERFLRGRGPGTEHGSFEDELRRRAEEFEGRGEYELAGAFFAALGDSGRAAACYRRLAEGVTP